MSDLAILGGEPIRKKPFESPVFIDRDEKTMIDEVINRKEFSRFMGSPTPDIEQQLTMPSNNAVDYMSQYFTFLGGRMVRRFEADFAKMIDVPFAISVNSCTSGLSTAFGACGLGPGDEVITTCMSFNATAMSILLFNSIPVFVDVSPRNYCLDPQKVLEAITDKTKAILVVHLLGFSADMDEIMAIARKYNLRIIEDCAQAPGAKYKGQYVGTFGDFGVFSFQETKNIMTGEGGMMICSDPQLARRARLIRNHGESIPSADWKEADLGNLVGMNFRMTEMVAALGIAQLRKMDGNNATRLENALYLCNRLRGLPGLSVPEWKDGDVPHLLPFLYHRLDGGPHRNVILEALKAEGVPVGAGYPRLMPHNPAFQKRIAYGERHCPWSCHLYGRERDYRGDRFPVAEELLQSQFIWFYHIGRPNRVKDMEDVAEAFEKVFSRLEAIRDLSLEGKAKSYRW